MAIQGAERKGRRDYFIKAAIGLIIPVYAGYVLGQYIHNATSRCEGYISMRPLRCEAVIAWG